jgi:hypothetical protein
MLFGVSAPSWLPKKAFVPAHMALLLKLNQLTKRDRDCAARHRQDTLASRACSAQRVIIAALTLSRHGCIMVDWSRPFDDPIQPPKGKKLITLKDAAAYILALPKLKQQSPEWQAAGEAVIMAAEDRGPLMHAHIGMMLALHRCQADSGIRFVEREALGTAKAEEGRMKADGRALDQAERVPIAAGPRLRGGRSGTRRPDPDPRAGDAPPPFGGFGGFGEVASGMILG